MIFKSGKFLVFSLIFNIILAFITSEVLAQWSAEQEAKSNVAIEKIKENKKNLPAHEKKIATYILSRINKMIAENAKDNRDILRRYRTRAFRVDENGLVLVNVALLKSTPQVDRAFVVDKIREFGGKLRPISERGNKYPREIYCWLPYDVIKDIAKIPQVGRILSIGVWKTRTWVP